MTGMPTEQQSRPDRRIAVCLSGVARNARQNMKFLRAFLSGSDVDVFFHFWDTPDAEFIVDALRPAAHVFESRDHAPPPAKPRRPEQFVLPSRLTNIPSMFYSVQRANAVKRAYEEAHGFRYDVVVRLRLDIFTITTLAEILGRLPSERAEWEGVLYVPDLQHAMGLNDQLALGTSETMDVYASTLDRLREVEHEDEMYVAEYVLLRHVTAHGLQVRTFPLEYVLLPADPIATFDLADRIGFTSRAWPHAPLPDVAPADLMTYLLAHADSYELVNALELEEPKSFRLRSRRRGYLRYDAASRQLAFAPDAAQATLFVLVLANDNDRRAVNIRARELLLGKTDGVTPRAPNLRSDERGVIHANGGGDDDESAFLIARAPGSAGGPPAVTFEWRPGFWRAPEDESRTAREVGGREQNPAPPPPRRPRRYLQSAEAGLQVAPAGDGAEVFELERVPDPAVEASASGLLGSVYTGAPRPGDPFVGRLAWMGYRAVRTIEERGPRAVVAQAIAFVRRRVSGDVPAPRRAKSIPERDRRYRI